MANLACGSGHPFVVEAIIVGLKVFRLRPVVAVDLMQRFNEISFLGIGNINSCLLVYSRFLFVRHNIFPTFYRLIMKLSFYNLVCN